MQPRCPLVPVVKMAPKLKIREHCPECGELQAWKEDGQIVLKHDCELAPPGPSNGVRWFDKSAVTFIPSDSAGDPK